mgnify:CR=1 FL=1
MTATELQNVEIPRDRFGRPMIIPPGRGTRRVAYRRTTTFVGCLDDMNGLMKWKARQVAYGMGQRRDLVMAAAASHPLEDKKQLGEIADKAADAAKSSAAADIGTALHKFTERIDKGKPLGEIPIEAVADIAAYQEATQHLEWEGIECFRVHDEWKIAGTADRIGRNQHGRLQVYDIKTGSIDYPHKMAMQLAMYARMTPYDIATDTRGEPEQVDLNTGIIIHLPAGQGICNLYEIDLAKGWGACLLAHKVWDWRGVKDLTHRVDADRVSTWEKSNSGQPAPTWETLAAAATTVDELRTIWTQAQAGGQLTPELRALCTQRSKELAA